MPGLLPSSTFDVVGVSRPDSNLLCRFCMPSANLLEIECLKCELLPKSPDLMWQTDSLRLRLRDVGHVYSSIGRVSEG